MNPFTQHARILLRSVLSAGLIACISSGLVAPVSAALSTSLIIRTSSNTDVEVSPSLPFFSTVDGPSSEYRASTAGTVFNDDAYAIALSSAAADAGSVAVNTYARTQGTFNGALVSYSAVSGLAQATASFNIDDVIFSGPGPSLNAALRLDMSGTLGASTEPAMAGTISRGTATFSVSLRVNNGSQQVGTRSYVSSETFGSVGTDGIVNDSGPSAGVDFPGTVTFNPVLVLTNTPTTVEVLLFAAAGASLDAIGIGEGRSVGSALFGATAHLPLAGPVFQLPAGYSARSTTANIVNNNWLGTPVSAAPVPLPQTMLLLASACALLARRHRSAS